MAKDVTLKQIDHPKKRHVRINLRLMLTLVAAAGALGGGLHLMRGHFLRANAIELQKRATQAYEAGRVDEAIEHLSRYLSFKPEDKQQEIEALLKLGQWTEERARTPRAMQRAYFLLDRGLLAAPKRDDIRRRVVRLAVRLGRFEDALRRLDDACANPPSSAEQEPPSALCSEPEMVTLQGQCHEALGRTADAANDYMKTIALSKSVAETDPPTAEEAGSPTTDPIQDRLDNYLRLVFLVQREGSRLPNLKFVYEEFGEARPTGALPIRAEEEVPVTPELVIELILKRMVSDVSPRFRALLARAEYYQFQSGANPSHSERAKADLKEALDLAPNDSRVLLQAADQALTEAADSRQQLKDPDHKRQQLNLARTYIERGRTAAPEEVSFILQQSRIALEEGDYAASERALRDGIAILEKRPLTQNSGNNGDAGPLTKDGELAIRFNWSLATTLIAEAFLQPGTPDEAKIAEVEGPIFTKMKELRARPAIVDFLLARILVGRQDWRKAANKLESIREELKGFSDSQRITDQLLAICYERLGDLEGRERVYRRGMTSDPTSVTMRLGLAQSLLSLDRIDDALEIYQGLMNVPSVPPVVARILIRRQMRQRPAQRRWELVDNVIARAAELNPGSADIVILKAEAEFNKGNFDAADSALAAARDASPDELELWVTLANLRLVRPDLSATEQAIAGQQVIEEAEQRFGDKAKLRQMRVQLALRQPKVQAQETLLKLAENDDKFTKAERYELNRTIARGLSREQAKGLALKFWQTAADLAPESIPAQMELADAAVRAGDTEVLSNALQRIREIEGPEGENAAYAEAHGLLVQEMSLPAAERNQDALSRARALLSKVASARPKSAAIRRELGILESLSPARDNAQIFAYFDQAFQLGDRSRETVHGVFQYLFTEKRYEELQQRIEQVNEAASGLLVSGQLAQIATLTADWLKQGNSAFDFAEQLGENAADYKDHLVAAMIQRKRPGQTDEAVRHLKAASELAPAERAVWQMRVAVLAEAKRTSEADAVIAEATEKVPAEPEVLRPWTLALCQEALGRRDAAEREFQKARAIAPADFALLDDLYSFYLRARNLEKASEVIQNAVDLAREKGDAKVLADTERKQFILEGVSARDDSTREQALKKLIDRVGEDLDKVDPADLQAEIAIVGQPRTRRDRDRLVKLLEALDRKQELAPINRLQLARLYNLNGDWTAAKAIFRRLRDADPGNLSVMAEFAQGALSHKEQLDTATLNEAIDVIQELARLEPGSYRSVALRAMLLGAQHRGSEAVPLLRKFLQDMKVTRTDDLFRDLVKLGKTSEALQSLTESAKKSGEGTVRAIKEYAEKLINGGDEHEAQEMLKRYIAASDLVEQMQIEFYRIVATLLESLDQVEAAEEVLREYVAKSPRAEAPLSLATFLGRQKRIDEALEVCDRAAEKCPPVVVARVSVAVLRAGNASPDQVARVEERLMTAIMKVSPDDANRMSLSLADLRDYQQRYRDAMDIYRGMLAKSDRDVVALNNLAWLQSFQPMEDREASLTLINRAIHLAGPIADLLDTRAIVRLNLGRPSEALQDLRSAANESRTPTILFHLAYVQMRNGLKDEAARSYSEAKDAGFDPRTLHPLEQPFQEELSRQLLGGQRTTRRPE